ncbi:Metallo-peptidase family M12-domain-containing protein [Aspergillus aurantiobrunneus]
MRVLLSALIVSLVWVFLATPVAAYSVRSISPYNTTTLQNVAINTPSQKVRPSAQFNLSFTLDGEERPVKLVLIPNHDLIIQEPHIQYIGGNGARRTEIMRRNSHKVFRGAVFVESAPSHWERVGWTRINMIQDGADPLFGGAFSISGLQYDVKVESHWSEQEGTMKPQMVVYRGYQDDVFTSTPQPAWSGPVEMWKRQFVLDSDDFVDNIGSTDGCPSERQIALVGIATDCTYTADFDSSEDLVQALVTMVNTASEVFESSFNVALSFHNLTIEEDECPRTATSEEPWNVGCGAGGLNFRLQAFSEWRAALRNDDNAYWTLMTGCPTGSEVGVSWVGELCNDETGANVVASAVNQWQVFAHESAHTFGAYHDCDASTCSVGRQCCPLSASTCNAGGQYIMNPVSSTPQTEFSPCTVGNVCSAIGSGSVSTRCLTTNPNTPTISAGECGNGILEVGEDCDCGEECDGNPCCDGTTCRFIGDAVCDDASGSCCNDCQFASAGTVCRAAISECDIEETCSGDSGTCPDDEHEDDGDSCGTGSDLFCSSGQCTNRDIQCQGQIEGDNSTISSCGNSTCILQCSSSWADSGSCSQVGNVLDGTPCDGGLCRSGVCRSRSDGGESWVDRHRPLVIGLAAGIGGLLVLAVLTCIVCCCCRRRPKSMPPITQPPLPLRPPPVPYMPPPAYSPRPMQAPPYYRYA